MGKTINGQAHYGQCKLTAALGRVQSSLSVGCCESSGILVYWNIIGMCFSFNPRCGGTGLCPAGAYESLHGLADGWIWDMIVWHSGLWDRPTGDINARAKRQVRWLLLIHGGLAVVCEYLCSKKTQEGKKSDSGISNSFLFSDGVKPWDKGWHKEEPKRSRHSDRWRRTRKKLDLRISLSPQPMRGAGGKRTHKVAKTSCSGIQ